MTRFGHFTLLALSTSFAGSSLAANFSVNPIRLELAPTQHATSLAVSNQGDETFLLQVSVFRWSHQDGEDVLTPISGSSIPSDAPIVTPPLFKLSGKGASQIVRIGFREPALPGAPESQWRIVVEELPRRAAEPSSPVPDGPPLAIAMRLRLSLPLFRHPATITRNLHWDGESVTGVLKLKAGNEGSITERLDLLVLRASAGGTPIVTLPGPIYIFPGERRSFEFTPAADLSPSGSMHLSVQGTPRPLVHELVFRAQ